MSQALRVVPMVGDWADETPTKPVIYQSSVTIARLYTIERLADQIQEHLVDMPGMVDDVDCLAEIKRLARAVRE